MMKPERKASLGRRNYMQPILITSFDEQRLRLQLLRNFRRCALEGNLCAK